MPLPHHSQAAEHSADSAHARPAVSGALPVGKSGAHLPPTEKRQQPPLLPPPCASSGGGLPYHTVPTRGSAPSPPGPASSAWWRPSTARWRSALPARTPGWGAAGERAGGRALRAARGRRGAGGYRPGRRPRHGPRCPPHLDQLGDRPGRRRAQLPHLRGGTDGRTHNRRRQCAPAWGGKGGSRPRASAPSFPPVPSRPAPLPGAPRPRRHFTLRANPAAAAAAIFPTAAPGHR